MKLRALALSAIASSLILSGCAQLNFPENHPTDAATDPVGRTAGSTHSQPSKQRLALAAVLGALPGPAIGRYMDNQQAALQELLAGSGVDVIRDGNTLQLQIPSHISFAINSSDIRAGLYPVLNNLSKVLAEYDKTVLVITGHTDDTGARVHNQKLSLARADAVKSYLLAQGVDERRLASSGMGPDQPLVANTSEANRAQNRRVEIRIEPLTQ